MEYSFPNQKKIVIHKDRPQRDFLQIQNKHWMEINKKYGPYALQLYLYFAKNADGFELGLSQEAAQMEAGIKKTTFHKYVNLFIAEGYLVKRNGNIYDFYEQPQNNRTQNENANESASGGERRSSVNKQGNSLGKQGNLQHEQAGSCAEQKSSLADKEIDIKDKNDRKDNITDKEKINAAKEEVSKAAGTKAESSQGTLKELYPVRIVHIPDPARQPMNWR